MNRVQMKTTAKEQLKGNVIHMFLITLVAALISYAATMIPVAGLLVNPVMSLAMAYAYLKFSKGVKPEINEVFSHFNELLPALKVSLLSYLHIVLWSLLLVVPGIIKAFAYSQIYYVLAENPGIGAREALKKSEEMMAGHKMELFFLSLSFVGWMILGSFTFGILYVWLIPYMQTTLTHFYNNIKSGESTDASFGTSGMMDDFVTVE